MSKAPPGEVTPEDQTAVDIGDLAARLGVLEKTAVPLYVGLVLPFLGAVIASLTGEQEVKPSFLLANGASVGRTKWPQLFNEFGTKFGSVDSATFNLPSMLGRVLVPRSTSGDFAVAAGSTGGAEQVALATAELPSHGHTLSGAPGSTLAVQSGTANIGNMTAGGQSSAQSPTTLQGGNNALNVSGGGYSAATHTHVDAGHVHALTGSVTIGTLAVGNTGSGTAHENLPPYLVIEGWLIYAGVQAL